MAEQHKGWIGVDLDGTLAKYETWCGPTVIGDPVPRMVARVKKMLADGWVVKIVTARVSPVKAEEAELSRQAVKAWFRVHVADIDVEVTHEKDYGMVVLWDDRCVQVLPNTGIRADLEDFFQMDEQMEEYARLQVARILGMLIPPNSRVHFPSFDLAGHPIEVHIDVISAAPMTRCMDTPETMDLGVVKGFDVSLGGRKKQSKHLRKVNKACPPAIH